MRINFLAAIAGICMCCCMMVSCLDSNTSYEFSSDATIRGFKLDTVAGLNSYKFTIDQLNGLIYNQDSLPMHSDTIINKTLMNITTNAFYMMSGDTLLNYASDSVDLLKPIVVKTFAADGVTNRQYTIKVNIHTQDPDSLIWTPISDSFSGGTVTGDQKAVILNDMILVYPSPSICYRTNNLSSTVTWSRMAVQGLPQEADIYSIVKFNEKLYAVASGDVYTSVDGLDWNKDQLLSGNVVTLLASFETGIAAIVTENGEKVFCVTDDEGKSWLDSEGNKVPEKFPVSRFSYAKSQTANGFKRVFLVGKTATPESATTPWQSYDGFNWANLGTNYADNLPYMETPTILYYNDTFYAFGDEFETFYTSVNGINWEEADEKFVFPEQFEGRSKNYSTVLDDNGYIWIIWSKTTKQNDEVWRGRLNKIGFVKVNQAE